MSGIFLDLLNVSISASWIVLAILLLRLLLRKAPKWIVVLLWGIVAVRLICPFTIESVVSLIPSAETISPQVLQESPEINTGFPALNNTLNPIIQDSTVAVSVEKSVNTLQLLVLVSSKIWAVGVVGMCVFTMVSYYRVRRRTETAILLCDNVFQSEGVGSPFVLGIIKPKIYLPFQMNEQDIPHVIAHEKAHIRRKDHLWKPVGFLLLTLHWFNPVMWVAYLLLCRDIELACDEKVIKELDTRHKADYSRALLACSVNRRMIAACPLAFGEVGVKKRIRSVLHYKRPAFWVIVAALVLCVAVGVCFLTSPLPKTDRIILTGVEGIGIDWSASYRTDFGKQVKSGTLWAELWESGKCVRTAAVPFTQKADSIDLSFAVRREEGQNEGVDVELATNQYGGSLLTYFAFPVEKEVTGWSLSSHKKGEGISVTPGEECVLAAMAFDTGHGVRSVDCKRLANDPEYLLGYDCLLLIRAAFSGVEEQHQKFEELTEPREVLTLDTIRKLAEKGEALSWEDFEVFDYVETGSGLYIRRYETDDPLFDLAIGGGDPEQDPMYIYLMANNGTEACVDIRTGDVEAFLEVNRDLPLMESVGGSWWWCRVEPKSGEHINDEIANLIANYTGVPAGSDPGQGLYLPVIRITNSRELTELASLVEGEVYSHPDGTDATPLQEKLKEYDDTYFAEKELIVVWPPDGNYTVNSVSYSRGTLSVVMEDINPDRDGITPVVGDWLIPVEIGKVAGSDEIVKIRSIAKPVGYPMRYFPRGDFLKNYTWWESGTYENPTFYLFDSGEAVFNFTTYSVNNGLAIWKQADGKLTLISKEKEESYVFDVTVDGYRYNAISSTGDAGITHGALFR